MLDQTKERGSRECEKTDQTMIYVQFLEWVRVHVGDCLLFMIDFID